MSWWASVWTSKRKIKCLFIAWNVLLFAVYIVLTLLFVFLAFLFFPFRFISLLLMDVFIFAVQHAYVIFQYVKEVRHKMWQTDNKCERYLLYGRHRQSDQTLLFIFTNASIENYMNSSWFHEKKRRRKTFHIIGFSIRLKIKRHFSEKQIHPERGEKPSALCFPLHMFVFVVVSPIQIKWMVFVVRLLSST